MKLDQQTGFLVPIRRVDSPHFNQRPVGVVIDLLVIHGIALPPGQFGGSYIEDLFLGQLDKQADPYFTTIADHRVSAHLLINRQGQVTQYVSCFNRAWHAGQSHWLGRDNCNDFSIGIELEGCDDVPYTDSQYQLLSQVASVLMHYFPAITPARIVGHSDIAPQRKTDPGSVFDWKYFKHLLSGNLVKADLEYTHQE